MREAGLMMLNLESAVTTRGTPEPKEYTFRVGPAAMRVLDGAGVDVVSIANNHAIDYGPVGLRDTLAVARNGPVPVVGIGRNIDEALRPHRVSIRGTDIAVFGVSTKDERARFWAAGEDLVGIAVSLEPSRRLLQAVRRASRRDDVVVVYLHWGSELRSCPTPRQRRHARALAQAGADVVVGAHAHVLLGAGWIGDTYVHYGLGNYLWYHDRSRETGILRLQVRNGDVVSDAWIPAENRLNGPELVPPPARGAAIAAWRALRGCTGLAPTPSR